jgi:hypothetical protein
MKTSPRIIISVLVLFVMICLPGHNAESRGYGHGGHGPHVGVGVWLGPGWWGPYYPPYYSPNYYPYYREAPIVIEQQPEIYVQPAPQPQERPIYWYYCKDAQGYYPYVKQCPGGWMKVVPTPPTPSSGPPEE